MVKEKRNASSLEPWANIALKESTTLLLDSDFWLSRLTVLQKTCYLSGMGYYMVMALSVLFGPLPGVLLVWARPDYVRYYDLGFAVPSLIYTLIVPRFWSGSPYGSRVQSVMVVQSYAYLLAIKDCLPGMRRGGAAMGCAESRSE